MSYDTQRKDFTQERIYVVEIDTPRCSRTFGVSPCLATGEKCFNTSGTCTYRSALDLSVTTTYRFASPNAAGCTWAGGEKTAIISVKGKPRVTDPSLDLAGGLGVRGASSVQIEDHPFDDLQFNADPYVGTRSYDPLEHGTFWTKFRARDPYFVGRIIRIMDGFIVDNVIQYPDMRKQTFVIESISLQDGSVSITAKDILKLADNRRAKFPRATNATLDANITAAASSLVVAYNGPDIAIDIPASGGKVRIDDEVIQYASRSGFTLTGLTRGVNNTAADEHEADAAVQLCREFNQQVHDIIATILEEGAGIDPSFFDYANWDDEINNEYPSTLNGIITEPTGVTDLLKEIGETAQCFLWWDSVDQLIKLKVSKQPNDSTLIFDADQNIIQNSYKVTDKPDMRISQVWVYFGIRNPVRDLDEAANYELLHVRADLESETPEEYGTQRVRTVYSRWISRTNKTAAVTLATKLGQRFGTTPREITFTLALKDADFGLADQIGIKHRLLTDATGAPLTLFAQVINRQQADTLSVAALEHSVGRIVPDDPATNFVIYPQSVLNRAGTAVSLRALYDDPSIGRFPPGTIPPATGVKFIIESGVEIVGAPGVVTGSWADLEALAGYAIPISVEVSGAVTGAGGKGGDSTSAGGAQDGGDGGDGFSAGHNCTVTVKTGGIVGAGGGGGGGAAGAVDGGVRGVGGGGGASYGLGGYGPNGSGTDGGLMTGGDGGYVSGVEGGEPVFVRGGTGGDLGQAGESGDGGLAAGGGGAAGRAVVKNGYTVTIVNAGGSVIGSVV